jgi:V-type H+-transporting ATPase subunit H
MLVAQLLPFVKNLCARKFSDEDILEDVQFVRDELTLNFQSLTYDFDLICDQRLNSLLICDNNRTYDEYSSELTSGHLSWTPVHESVDFWKENAVKLNDRDYEQLKCVIPLLVLYL